MRAVSEHSAVGVGVGFSSYKITDVEYNSIAGSLFYRYYFSEVLKRWYATGGVSYYSGKVKYDGDKDLLTENLVTNGFGIVVLL
jgi:hypothetical protein